MINSKNQPFINFWGRKATILLFILGVMLIGLQECYAGYTGTCYHGCPGENCPEGSYRLSCVNCKVKNNVLQCYCAPRDHQCLLGECCNKGQSAFMKETTIKIDDYTETFQNSGGRLTKE